MKYKVGNRYVGATKKLQVFYFEITESLPMEYQIVYSYNPENVYDRTYNPTEKEIDDYILFGQITESPLMKAMK